MMSAKGEPIIMDFGLAKRSGEFDCMKSKLTQQGAMMGTPSYMSPEQVRGDIDQIGPATDIYALGVILFEMLSGRTPYGAPMFVVMAQILTSPVPPLREFRPDADVRLEAICQQAMAKDIAARPASMALFAAQLGDFQKHAEAVIAILLPDATEHFVEDVFVVDNLLQSEESAQVSKAPIGKAKPFRLYEDDLPAAANRLPGRPNARFKEIAKVRSKPTRKSKRSGWRIAIVLASVFLLVIACTLLLPSLLPKGLPKTLTIKLSDTEALELMLVDPQAQPDRGEFLMGSSAENLALIKKKGWTVYDNETEHKVKLTKPYYLGKYEVTRGQFSTFLNAAGEKTEAEEGDGGYRWTGDKQIRKKDKKYTWKNSGYRQEDNHPVVLVSWNDSKKFTRWMAGRAQLQQVSAKLSGRKWDLGLPSEAQWEYANRSPKQTLFAHGDDEEELANYSNVADGQIRDHFGTKRADWKGIQADDKYVFTSPVGSGHFRPNRFGIYDMTGNVWEWCEDYYGKYDDVLDRDNPIQSDKQLN